MRILRASLIPLFLLTTVGSAVAGESEVTWTDPDKYTDVRSGNENRKHFKERIFKSFEKHFAKLSQKLPEGKTLKINVTNVDLAGDVRFSSMQQIRIVKDIYIPRLEFSYELVNADKSLAASGEVDLKDMGFMTSSSAYKSSSDLYYEKRMINKWFKNNFIPDKID
ncbi:DUF3016 domain-containing protein [Pseudocolwellia sp. HL-MZ7]|uniref:DUF3016 domain-containing protein n=1 Tax=Pseudocolwellia sp. HL-MZ7 TaxID=3400627 RepID=UPI003CF624E9